MPTLLSSALLDRGVLLEVCGQDIYLTDNIYLGPPGPAEGPYSGWRRHIEGPSDAETVSTLLRETGLNNGLLELPPARLWHRRFELQEYYYWDLLHSYNDYKEVSQELDQFATSIDGQHRAFRLAQPDCEISADQYRRLFSQPHYQQEAQGPGHWRCDSLRHFKRYAHSPKIPLALLNPYIAMLVKGLSAVGCYSWCSCQGHGRRPLRIDLIDRINADWAQHLLDKARNRGLELDDLSVDGELLIETNDSLANPERDEWVVRQQAIRFGRFLYDNRLALREERQGWADAYSVRAAAQGTE